MSTFRVLLVGATGLVYAAMAYLMEPIDEFAVINHPLQPQTQHAHIWFAPLLVFSIGLIWRAHVWKHFRNRASPRRRSGLALLLGVAPMIVSGYLIQTSAGGFWRQTWVAIHLVTSFLFLASYLVHQSASWRKKHGRASPATQGAEDPRALTSR